VTQILHFLLRLVGTPLTWIYRTVFGRLELRHAVKRNEAFADELGRVVKSLLIKYNGVVSRTPDSVIVAFDYRSISVSFPDREFSFTCGRNEFDVYLTMSGVGMIPIYSDSCSSRDDDEIRLLERSARFIAEYWDQIPSATFQQMRSLRSAFEGRNA
jgi:hypothetical protein